MPRWETFHHVHIIGRVLKRMPACSALAQADSAPGAPGWHVLNAHLPWLLQPLLQLACDLRYVWSQEASHLHSDNYRAASVPDAQQHDSLHLSKV